MGRASISSRATRSASGFSSLPLARPENTATALTPSGARPRPSNGFAILARNCLRQRRYSAGLMLCRLQMAVSGFPRSPSSTTLAFDAGSHCRAGTRPPLSLLRDEGHIPSCSPNSAPFQSFLKRPVGTRSVSFLPIFCPASINQHQEDVNRFGGRVWTTRRSRVPGGPTQCRSSLPEGSKPRRDHLFVGRRPREKPCLPRKGVEGVHRVPGNLRIVKRRVAPHELGDQGELRRGKMSFCRLGGERGVVLQRALRPYDGAHGCRDLFRPLVDRFLSRDERREGVVPRALRPVAAPRVDDERADSAPQSHFGSHAVCPKAVHRALLERFGRNHAERGACA